MNPSPGPGRTDDLLAEATASAVPVARQAARPGQALADAAHAQRTVFNGLNTRLRSRRLLPALDDVQSARLDASIGLALDQATAHYNALLGADAPGLGGVVDVIRAEREALQPTVVTHIGEFVMEEARLAAAERAQSWFTRKDAVAETHDTRRHLAVEFKDAYLDLSWLGG